MKLNYIIFRDLFRLIGSTSSEYFSVSRLCSESKRVGFLLVSVERIAHTGSGHEPTGSGRYRSD